MDFKISIKCEKCRCVFELRPAKFADREILSCPNCGQEMDNSVFSNLKNGLLALSQVPDVIPEDASAFAKDGENYQGFSFQIKEYNFYNDLLGKTRD